MNKIVILAGASGVGKTSVAKCLLNMCPNFAFVRSATTRKPRGDGNDGEYIYVSKDEFRRLVSQDEFLEYMEYGENLYGTPKSELNRIFNQRKTPLLILDIQGVKSIREKHFDFEVFTFYLFAELDVVEKRLYKRELFDKPTNENLKTFRRRMEANIRDYRSLPEIKHLFNAFIDNSSEIEISAKKILEYII